MMMAEQLEH